MYQWGAVLAGIAVLSLDRHFLSRFADSANAAGSHFTCNQIGALHVVLAFVTAIVGLVTANILRKKDNLVKLVGISACVVTITASQLLFFPAVTAHSLSAASIFGLGVITTGAWCYSYFTSTAKASAENTAVSASSAVSVPLLSQISHDSAFDSIEDPSLDDKQIDVESSAPPDPALHGNEGPALEPTRWRIAAVLGVFAVLSLVYHLVLERSA